MIFLLEELGNIKKHPTPYEPWNFNGFKSMMCKKYYIKKYISITTAYFILISVIPIDLLKFIGITVFIFTYSIATTCIAAVCIKPNY